MGSTNGMSTTRSMITLNNQRILVVAAHPDDEVLGCGGLLKINAANGGRSRVLFLGEGSSCRSRTSTTTDIERAVAERQEAAKTAAKLLGGHEVVFGDLTCGRFHSSPRIEANHVIESSVDEFNPSIVLTHSNNDVNLDHKAVYESTLMALRPVSSNARVHTLATFEVMSSTEWNTDYPFQPNLFVPMSEDHLETKIEAMNCYATELRPFPFPRSPEGIRAYCTFRGMQVGQKYAEAFHIIRSVAI